MLVPLLVLLLHAAALCQCQKINLYSGQMFSGSFTDFTTPVDDLQVIANFQDGSIHRYPAVQLWGDQYQPAPFITARFVLAGCTNSCKKESFQASDINACYDKPGGQLLNPGQCPLSCPGS